MIVAGMIAFAGITQAEEAKEKPKKGISPELLEKYDTDKDGKLSKEEKAAMKKDQPAKPKAEKKPKVEKAPKAEKTPKAPKTEKEGAAEDFGQ